MVIKCAICNKEFEPSKQVCKQILKEPDKPRFCSAKCKSQYIANKNKKVIKYNCDYCGKEFILSSDQRIRKQKDDNVKLFCGRQCSGKYNMSIKDNIEKRNKHSQQTKLERYGNDTFNNRNKAMETVLERYGVVNVAQTEKVKDRIKQVKLERYGDEKYNNRLQIKQTITNKSSEELRLWHNKISNSIKTTLNNRSDDEWNEIKEKLSKSNKEAWDNFSEEEILNIKKKLSNAQKVRWDKMSLEDKQKLFKKYRFTMLEKYGSIYNFTRKDVIEKARQNNGHTISKRNIKTQKYIKDNYNLNFELEKDGFDLVYKDIALEINPSFTHNTLFSFAYKTGRSNKNIPLKEDYHLQKTKNAEKLGYRCIHIFDWDNLDKVLYLIQDKETLYARNLTIKEVDKDTCNEFLNNYHIQNTCRGQEIRLGLYKDKELIEIMTFGKPRYNKNYEYELLRLCTHKDFKVVGGAEKLFKHFIKTYKPKSIISYCDYSKFSGDVYQRLGFVSLNKPTPSKHWSREDIQITDNLLRQRGYDQLFNTNYGKGTDNEELMLENGWLPIYDCGQLTFSWKEGIDNEINS